VASSRRQRAMSIGDHCFHAVQCIFQCATHGLYVLMRMAVAKVEGSVGAHVPSAKFMNDEIF